MKETLAFEDDSVSSHSPVRHSIVLIWSSAQNGGQEREGALPLHNVSHFFSRLYLLLTQRASTCCRYGEAVLSPDRYRVNRFKATSILTCEPGLDPKPKVHKLEIFSVARTGPAGATPHTSRFHDSLASSC